MSLLLASIFSTLLYVSIALPPPNNLQITPDDANLKFVVSYDPYEDLDDREYVLFRIRILYNDEEMFDVWRRGYNHTFEWHGYCITTDVYVSAIGEDGVESDFVWEQYYLNANTLDFFSATTVFSRIIHTTVMRPGWQHDRCRFEYDIQMFLMTGEMFKNTSVTEPIHEFNFMEEKFICKRYETTVTPRFGDMVGRSRTMQRATNVELNDFFFMGPPVSLALNLQCEDKPILKTTWSPPLYHETCTVIYVVVIYDVLTDEILYQTQFASTATAQDFDLEKWHGLTIRVEVTSKILDNVGGTVVEEISIPPQDELNC